MDCAGQPSVAGLEEAFCSGEDLENLSAAAPQRLEPASDQ